jgi:hypothetical protein
MRRVLATLLLTAAVAANGQEGFPLDGTWRGQREADGRSPATLVMVMQWDGQKITGLINPGPKSVQISEAVLVPEGWRVRLAARTASGDPITFEGTMAELGSYHRRIEGTWTEGGRTYRVRMTRE